MNSKNIFFDLINAKNEKEVDQVLETYNQLFENINNWFPLGGEQNMFGVIENQQSNPIAALIEKTTNSIDAILTKKCLEAGIDPKSSKAPKSINRAIEAFFPDQNWDLPSFRHEQACEIQVIADGYYKDRNKNTSLIIYDNGEGQHPECFESTFLSLLRGNKNDIHFVQGKYNMGGSGAIVFCGEKRYQLIGSKRYDNTGKFGFTLIRQHPLSKEEEKKYKNTWYEYFKLNGEIPSFHIDKLDINLHGRKFTTGSIIKLYSYDLPSGSSSVISRDLNQSINEHLFEPALPILTIDTKERYPDDKNLARDLYGLKRRIDSVREKYLDYDPFSLELSDEYFGDIKVTCYVFKTKVEEKTVVETKNTVRNEFFKNNMSVLFSINGQVHGHYTSEFISRSLKFHLLKDYLLIHVDCTKVNLKVRNELFMASRDRLKKGKNIEALRKYLARHLQKSKLKEIVKERKDSIGLHSEDTISLIKDFANNIPKNPELMKLLHNSIKLKDKKKNIDEKSNKKKDASTNEPINLKRFPSYFRCSRKKRNDDISVINIPLNGEKTVRFETDVENDYFDRIDEPGELQIDLLKFSNSNNHTKGGDGRGKKLSERLNIIKSSPSEGTIKLTLNPSKESKVGDEIETRITLTSPGENFDDILLVRVVAENKIKEPKQKERNTYNDIGLPELVSVKKDKWSQVEELGKEFNHGNIVVLESDDGDLLEKIYINIDSTVFKNFISKHDNQQQIEYAEKRFLTSIYFHVLFLYTINLKNKYSIQTETDSGDENNVPLSDYLESLFDDTYSEFILNFGADSLMNVLDDN